jgi:hypothetical protein
VAKDSREMPKKKNLNPWTLESLNPIFFIWRGMLDFNKKRGKRKNNEKFFPRGNCQHERLAGGDPQNDSHAPGTDV